MKKKTPVSAYRLLSSPSNKPIVFVSFYETPCMRKKSIFKLGNETGLARSATLGDTSWVRPTTELIRCLDLGCGGGDTNKG